MQFFNIHRYLSLQHTLLAAVSEVYFKVWNKDHLLAFFKATTFTYFTPPEHKSCTLFLELLQINVYKKGIQKNPRTSHSEQTLTCQESNKTLQ